ncbi:MAG: TolC family protein [Myxococcales bacterium]|nr:TolC family protein [Myxococcales bacterium]MCB9646002.1 TolC family protein [Deltaproteobacteria bacterium]
MQAALIIPLALGAVGAEPGGGLDIKQAVEVALARAPALEARRAQEAAARAQAESASGAYLPRITFEANYLARSPKNKLPVDLPTIPGVSFDIGEVDDVHHLQVGLQAGYRVFDLSRGHRVDAARVKADAEVAETEARAADLAYGVRATFLAALYARDVRDITQASLALAREEEKRSELRVKAGVESDVALAQAKVRVAGLAAQARRASLELERYRARLASLMGQDSLPELEGDLEALGAPTAPLDPEAHPELRRLAALEQASLQMASARKLDLVPTLTVMGRASLQYPRAMKLELGPVYEAGATLSWSIFDGFQRGSDIDAAKAQAEALARMSEATRENLARDLIDLDARAKTAEADLASADETLQQTQVYLRVARASVSAGAGTELDVHTAELGLDQAKVARKKALFERAMIRAETLKVYGRGASPSGGAS